MRDDPLFRKFHHDRLTFSLWYAFNENFVLPLSHDEVVHGKGSMINKMPGDSWQQFANLRALYGYMWAHPGKKLLFMGCEFGQRAEWAHDGQLEWHLTEHPEHASLQRWVSDLNRLYRDELAMHEVDHAAEGFEWIDCTDAQASVIAFLRKPRTGGATLLVACNFTPLPRANYLLGVPYAGFWQEALNSDAELYGGSGWGNLGGVEAAPVGAHGQRFSVSVTLPPLSVVFFRSTVDG
jgi:1,4-alpha-glucan branching enzyme